MPLLASGSIPEVGSSNMTTSDPPMSAMPRFTFLFIPPLNLVTSKLVLGTKLKSLM